MAPSETPSLPILWSFRRCPYAIRARLALAQAKVPLETREVNLAVRPPEFLALGAPGTVPQLVLPDGARLQQSLEIMIWALEAGDPGDCLRRAGADTTAAGDWEQIMALVEENDGPFKHHLDRFKYASRFPDSDPAVHREAALAILRRWNGRLEPANDADEPHWLLGERSSLADWALLPFVRQFRLADPEGFAAASGLTALRTWLARFEAGHELAAVMAPPLAPRQPWRSPSWLYHLALAGEWRQALAEGVYRRSTRGLALEQVGFLHASHANQIAATFERFYQDAGPVLLLTIDPERLNAAGLEVDVDPKN